MADGNIRFSDRTPSEEEQKPIMLAQASIFDAIQQHRGRTTEPNLGSDPSGDRVAPQVKEAPKTKETERKDQRSLEGDRSSRPSPRLDGNLPRAGKVLELQYGDPDLDAKLAQSNHDTIRIKQLPENVQVMPWVDSKGFFLWFKNGHDNKAPHYVPDSIRRLEVEQKYGRQTRQDVADLDNLRMQAVQGSIKEQQAEFLHFEMKKPTDVKTYLDRLSNLSGNGLGVLEKFLKENGKSSPDNPYFPLYQSLVSIGQAFGPVLKDHSKGYEVTFNNSYTLGKIDEALAGLKTTLQVTARQGDIPYPNVLGPVPRYEFGISPIGQYWTSAAHQAFTTEIALKGLRSLITSGALDLLLKKDALPPALPPG